MDNKITPKQEKAFDLYQRCVFLRKKQGELALEFGRVLKEIRDKKLYRYLGEGGFETFNQFLANPEINLNPNTALAYIRVYEYYVLELNIPKENLLDIPFNRLNNLKSKIEKLPREEQEEWIEKAKTLSYTDFKAELQEKKMEKKPFITVKRCKQCGQYEIYYDQSQICVCRGGHAVYALPIIEEVKK